MYLFLYVLHICMYVCMYIYIYIYIYLYRCIYIYIYIHTYQRRQPCETGWRLMSVEPTKGMNKPTVVIFPNCP